MVRAASLPPFSLSQRRAVSFVDRGRHAEWANGITEVAHSKDDGKLNAPMPTKGFWSAFWPCAILRIALTLVLLLVPVGWNVSLVQAPGVSVLDGLIYLLVGGYAAQRTGVVSMGTVVGAATGVIAVAVTLMAGVVTEPDLLLAPFRQPFIVVILSMLTLIGAGSGAVLGSIGGGIGRSLALVPRRAS